MELNDIRMLIIRPALQLTNLWSNAAENLVLGTGLIESNYEYLKQINGPALGYWEIEPETHADVKKWLNSRINKPLADRVLAACFMSVFPDDNALVWNFRYSCIMCRLVYTRKHEELPPGSDVLALANFYKQYYNTSKGKADIVNAIELFRKVV